MFAVTPDLLPAVMLSLFLIAGLGAALALVTVTRERAATAPLLVAGGLIVVCLLVVVVSPVYAPAVPGLFLALIGTAVAVIGGDPVARRVLDAATHGDVRDGDRGGILVSDPSRLNARRATRCRSS